MFNSPAAQFNRASRSGPLSNYTATVDPTATDDASLGYAAGSNWFNTTTQVIWRNAVAAAGSAVWVPLQASDHPGYVSGRVYETVEGGTIGSVAVPNKDILYLYPYFVRSKVSVASLVLRIVTVATGDATVKAGIWSSRNGKPFGAALLASNTGVATNAVNVTVSASGTLYPGAVWIGSIHNFTTGALPAAKGTIGTSSAGVGHLGGRSTYSNNNGVSGYSITGSNGNVNVSYGADITAYNFNGTETYTDIVANGGVPAIGIVIT